MTIPAGALQASFEDSPWIPPRSFCMICETPFKISYPRGGPVIATEPKRKIIKNIFVSNENALPNGSALHTRELRAGRSCACQIPSLLFRISFTA